MSNTESRWHRVADGLGLVLIGLNVFWMAATLTVLVSALGLRGGSLFLAVWWVVPPLLFLTGLVYCRHAPVPPTVRRTLWLALLVFLLAALIGLGVGVLEFLIQSRRLPPAKVEALFPAWLGSVVLAIVLSGSGHLLFLHSLRGLSRSIDKEWLAERAQLVFRLLLGLVAFAAAVYFGANETGQIIGAGLLLVGGLGWLCLYSFLLIRLHQAVLFSAAFIPSEAPVDDEIVTLATFANPFEAAQVKGRLEEEGIRVFQSGEHSNGLLGGGGVFGRIELHVAEKDLKRAMCILTRPAEDDDEEEDDLLDDGPDGTENSTEITSDVSPRKGSSESNDAIQAQPPTRWSAVTNESAAEPEEAEDEPPTSRSAEGLVKAVLSILFLMTAIFVLIALLF